MHALEITFSSSRTLPGQGCCNIAVCARRVSPKIFFPYASLYFFRKKYISNGIARHIPSFPLPSPDFALGLPLYRGTRN